MFCSLCGATITEGVSFCPACGQAVSAGGAMQGGAPTATQAFPPHPPMLYAGFWLRFVSYLIDGIVLGIPFVIVFAIFAAATGLGAALSNIHAGEPPDAIVALLGFGFIFGIVVIGIVGGWLYYAMMESSSWQGTLGKRALGLYVTDMEGRRISFARASGRFFSKLITGLIPLAIGYIMAGFTAKKQALHDMIASCLVLRKM